MGWLRAEDDQHWSPIGASIAHHLANAIISIVLSPKSSSTLTGTGSLVSLRAFPADPPKQVPLRVEFYSEAPLRARLHWTMMPASERLPRFDKSEDETREPD